MDTNAKTPKLDNDIPPLVWPEFVDLNARVDWWRTCVLAWSEEWNRRSPISPVPASEIEALEQRLGCTIPPLLRSYHEHIGTLNLAETLCSVQPAPYAAIEPLTDAYPGITDLLEELPDSNGLRNLVDQLIAFGDYLGNGNLWCFHRVTGEVWYFDHDCPPMLTQMFSDVGQYLDLVMFKCLLTVHGEEDNEEMLREKLGDALVEKWMY
ncbi:SMI1/KNR4 family protein [Escherichia whittamii]|uniref:SMI1/KNR4 family protein n=1 Tax=Escherichia whittamii TaxID=2762229 RepID=A0ABR8TFA2_9ESCH|nr:SMI1/KNR4 family protein [Escherichia whittamii]MBD7974455.1 SMI1/KNR4 family protein [Escherichia whittamii]MCA4892117.1 SMI1/KNR4 family protein [Escherichia whittamii]